MKWYRFCLIKAYFDKGYAVTTYLKYLIIFFGVASLDVRTTMIIAIIYGLSCFLTGYLWFKLRIVDAELEVSNRFNPFVKEMRELSGNSVHRKP